MKKLSIWLDEQLHKEFKLYCVKNGNGMTELILDYIRGVLGKKSPKKAVSGALEGSGKDTTRI